MKIVLDTNILISAIVFDGKPEIILKLIIQRKSITAITSNILMNELLGVLKKKFKYSKFELNRIRKLIRDNFLIIKPDIIPKIIKNDPFDNQVLAVAIKSSADFIISGDNHLLKLKRYKNILITTPHNFLRKILQ